MKSVFLLFVCLAISLVCFGQDKTGSSPAAPEIPPGPSMKETAAWIKREIPSLGAHSIVTVKNDDRSKSITWEYRIESAVLSDGRLSIRRTELMGEYLRLNYTETVTLKDVDVSKIRAVEVAVGTGYTNSRPSYYVSLNAAVDRGAPFTSQRKQEGFPADDMKPMRWIRVRVRDEEAANRVADALRRAAVLCGAPSQPVETAVAEPAQKTEISPTKPASPASSKMTNDEVIQLVAAGLSEQVVTTSIRQAPAKDFDLTTTGLISLKKAGVSDALIVVMQERDAPAQTASASEAKTPPKYDATLAEPKQPAATPVAQDPCAGIEMMGLFTEDMRPVMPLIIYLAKIRNGTNMTKIVTLQWLDMYGQALESTIQVGAGQIATLQLSRNSPVDRRPINLRITSCR